MWRKHRDSFRLPPVIPPPTRLLDRAFYQITVKGCLDRSWSEWLDNLAIAADQERDETTISGLIPDQAALYGLLTKLHDLCLPLMGVTRREVK